MKNLFAILVIIPYVMGVCVGCKQSIIQNDDCITVDVMAKYPKKELFLQDFLDVEYIPLETSDEFVTSARIHAVGKKVMIFTSSIRGNNDIFIFDRNGKGVRKINQRGQGPGEYAVIYKIVLDEDKEEMYIDDIFTNNIFVYDLLGNFKRSFHQKEGIVLTEIGNLNRENIICHDAYFEIENGEIKYEKKNYFLTISKQDGSIKDIYIPYKEKRSTIQLVTGESGLLEDRSMFNKELLPNRDNWILAECSVDTIYSYSPDEKMKPIIVRTPSIQSMNPEIFLFPGVLTDHYYFMQIVKKQYDFTENGFPRTDIIYDRHKKALFECVVYNDDFTKKIPMSLVWEHPMFSFGNNDIAFIKKLETHELVEAYEKGQLKGKLKEIAAKLNEEDNAVIMLAKYKNEDR